MRPLLALCLTTAAWLPCLACGEPAPPAAAPTRSETSRTRSEPVGPVELASLDSAVTRVAASGELYRGLPGARPDDPQPIRLDPERPLRGRAVSESPLPADETLVATLHALPHASPSDETLGFIERYEFMSDWDSTAYEVARVEVGADGRFDLPRPVDAARVRVRLEGDYARGGSIEYDLGSDDEPAGDVFEVPVELGAHVTLALIPPPGASPSEFARLTGREASLHSSTAYVVGRSEHAGTVGPDGQVILRRLPEGTCGFTNSYTGAAPLAPFFVPNDFSFTAEAGVRSVVEVPLLRGREFSGRVETEDGTRVPGAEITLEFAVRSPSSGRSWSRRETSDVTGHFWFEAMQAAPRACTVKLDRGRPVLALEGAALEALLAVDDPALVVPSTRTVRVRFRMPDGRAARFLHVDIRFPEAPDLNTTARTADDGTVRVVLPVGRRVEVTARGVRGDRGAAGSEGSVDFERPGPVAPFVRGPGSDPAAPSENTIARDDRPLWFATVPGERIAAAREDTPVEVELEPAPIVSGFVSGADPSEALGPRVTLLTLEEARRRRPRELEGQEGVDSTRSLDRMAPAFAFAAVPGEYVAYASRGRGASMTVSEPVTVAVGPDGATVGLTLPPRRRLEGRLVDTTNAPLAEIHVGLQGTGDRRLSINRETTDERGVFRFERVLPGTYTCWLDSERYVLATKPRVVIAADSPPPPVELVASPAGAIRARAVGPDGLERPECGFDVRSAEGRHFGRRMIKDDRAWRGAIGPLLPGTYTVEAYCGPDGAPDRSGKSPLVSASATVEVRPGALSTVEVVVPTELGASVRGRITAGGSPVREANAWLELDGGPTVSSRTDEDGRFELPVPGAGAGTLRCNAEWGRGGVIVERRIQVGGGVNELQPIEFPAAGLRGVIVDRSVELDPFDAMPNVFSRGATEGDPALRVCTGSMNGRFEIPYLADGAYVVALVRRSGKWITSAPFEIRGGAGTDEVELVLE